MGGAYLPTHWLLMSAHLYLSWYVFVFETEKARTCYGPPECVWVKHTALFRTFWRGGHRSPSALRPPCSVRGRCLTDGGGTSERHAAFTAHHQQVAQPRPGSDLAGRGGPRGLLTTQRG